MDEKEVMDTQAQAQPVQDTAPETKQEEKFFTQADLDRIINDRLKSERRKADEKAAEAARKAQAEEAEKNGEWKVLAEQRQAELEKLADMLKVKELNELRMTIAKKVGIPDALAVRLIGETEDDIMADAVNLFSTLPKPTSSVTVGNSTNPSIAPKLTRESISRMSPDEINRNWEAVAAAMQDNR